VENLYFYSCHAIVLLIRLTTAARIGSAKVRSWAVFIEGRSKARTVGIDTYGHCSLDAGRQVILDCKSVRIDREYLTSKKWGMGYLTHSIKHDEARLMGAPGRRQWHALGPVQME
jgi:hypothetical protein